MIDPQDCAAVILAGGEGRRMQGLAQPKPLLLYRGKALIEHQLDNLHGIEPLFISTELGALASYGRPLLSDGQAERLGPLAGIASALAACAETGQSHLLVCPVDTPAQPANLLPALAARGGNCPLVYARAGRDQPLHSLWSVGLLAPLRQYLAAEERRVMGFLQQQGAQAVDFADREAFANINRPAQL